MLGRCPCEGGDDGAGSMQEEIDERMRVLLQKRRDRAFLQTLKHHVRKQRGVQKPGASVDLQAVGGPPSSAGRDFSRADSFPAQGLLSAVEGPDKITCLTVNG